MEAWLGPGHEAQWAVQGERCGFRVRLRFAAALVFARAWERPPRPPGCRSASVSTEDAAFLCSKSTRMICSPLAVSVLQTRQQSRQAQESLLLEPSLFGRARPGRLFISFKLPGPRAFLRNSFFSKVFFFFSFSFFFAPSNILFKRKWDVYLLFPYFFSGKQRVVDFLPLPSLPSFFPKVLIWEKENEVLFLFSFLSHLKHCPCEFFKFPAICTREKEGERGRGTERAGDQVKHGAAAATQTQELVSYPCNPFCFHSSVPGKALPGASPQKMPYWVWSLIKGDDWWMAQDLNLNILSKKENWCIAEMRLAELEIEVHWGWAGHCVKSEFGHR